MHSALRKRSARQSPLKANTCKPAEKLFTRRSSCLENRGSEAIYTSQTKHLLHRKETQIGGSTARNTSCPRKGSMYRSSSFRCRSERFHTGWKYCRKSFVFILSSHKASSPFSASRSRKQAATRQTVQKSPSRANETSKKYVKGI